MAETENEVTEQTATAPTIAPPAEETTAPALKGMALVDATWAELGFKIEPVGKRVFVRTDAPPKKIGLIYIPPEMWGMYGKRLGSQETVTATVLANGPRVKEKVELGAKVCFFRLPFGWTYKLADGTFVGWIDSDEIVGVTEQDDVRPFIEE